jgi:signal transduction histidine kinase
MQPNMRRQKRSRSPFGKGFDMETQAANIGHGLANMQTRAQSAGGDVDVSSAPGEGTTILAWVPRNKTS